MQFSYFVTSIISSQIYFICEVHRCLLEFFFQMIVLNQNLIQYTSNKQKSPKCDVYIYIRKLNVKMQYLWLQFLGAVMCFYPFQYYIKLLQALKTFCYL
jgi:hypothetical protein